MAARNPKAKVIATIKLSTAKLAELDATLFDITNGVPRALSAAINRTAYKGKPMLRKGLTGLLTIKAANLKRRIYSKKATPQKLQGSITLMGRHIGLINFKNRDTKVAGVIAQVYQGGEKITLPHAFIATGKFGNRHVFQREGRKRLPIDTRFSQQLYNMYLESKLAKSYPEELQATFNEEIDIQIDRLLKKRFK